MLESVPKIGEKKVSAGQNFFHTNHGVCRPKKGITLERKILKRESNTDMKKNETSSIRNLLVLLPHVLLNAQKYQCVSKKTAEEPLSKYIILQK